MTFYNLNKPSDFVIKKSCYIFFKSLELDKVQRQSLDDIIFYFYDRLFFSCICICLVV